MSLLQKSREINLKTYFDRKKSFSRSLESRGALTSIIISKSKEIDSDLWLTLGTPRPTLPPVALILSLGSSFSPESKSRSRLSSLMLAIKVEYV